MQFTVSPIHSGSEVRIAWFIPKMNPEFMAHDSQTHEVDQDMMPTNGFSIKQLNEQKATEMR